MKYVGRCRQLSSRLNKIKQTKTKQQQQQQQKGNISFEIVMNGTILKEVPTKKVIIDQDVSFKTHTEEETKAGFKAWRALEISENISEDVHSSLFWGCIKHVTLLLPLFD